MTSCSDLPNLTSAEYYEAYDAFLTRKHGRENANHCISKCLDDSIPKESDALRVLAVGPGDGDVELKLLAPYKIQHLIAVEPSTEMVEALEKNLRSSSDFIMKWNIEHTDIESYLQNKGNSEGPFDIILMIHSIYYCSSPGKVMQQLRASLQPKTGQLIILVADSSFAKLAKKYKSTSEHAYNGDDVVRDLNDAHISCKRYIHPVTTDITDVKGDAKLEWAFASFYLSANVAYGRKNLASDVINDMIDMATKTNDGQLWLIREEDVFVISPVD